jgi:hypothetical protein
VQVRVSTTSVFVWRTSAGTSRGAPAHRAPDDAPLRKCAANDKPAAAAAANLSSSSTLAPRARFRPRLRSRRTTRRRERRGLARLMPPRGRAVQPRRAAAVCVDAEGEVVQTWRMRRRSWRRRRRRDVHPARRGGARRCGQCTHRRLGTVEYAWLNLAVNVRRPSSKQKRVEDAALPRAVYIRDRVRAPAQPTFVIQR